MKSKTVLLLSVFMFMCVFSYVYSQDPAAKENTPKQLDNNAEDTDYNTLAIWSSLRLRYEYQDGFNAMYYGDDPAAGDEPDDFLSGRVRAGLRYSPLGYLNFSLGLQYADVWGESFEDEDYFNKQFDREHNSAREDVEPFDCYLEISDPFTKIVTVKAGRQQIFYGDTRVFGPGNWSNTGTWIWDAAKLSLKYKKHFIDMYYGKTMVHDPDEFSLNHRHGYESMGLYTHFQFAALFKQAAIEPFAMTKKNDSDFYSSEDKTAGSLDTYYAGARIYGNDLYGIDFDATYLRQYGDYSKDEIEAYAYHILLGYSAEEFFLKPRISAEYSFASGDSDPSDGKNETFDGAFSGRAMFYGRMNLMHWKNLKDAQINLELKPLSFIGVKIEYHRFYLAESKDAWYFNSKLYRDKTGESGDDLGQEFDIVVKIKAIKGNKLELGYGYFMPGEFVKAVASDDDAGYFYGQWVWDFDFPIL